jgi:hypothetical protein
MYEIRMVMPHFLHYILWIVVVAETVKRRKTKFDRKYLDNASVIQPMDLLSFDFLVKRVEHWFLALLLT